MSRSPEDPTAPGRGGPQSVPTELLDDRYRLESMLGQGGMGVVYRAFDTRLNRLVAVKVLLDAEDADAARFEAEVQILARFVHPNLVRLLDAGELGRRPYLVMDLVEGPTLARRLADGRLTLGETAKLGAGVASALAYVHDAGIVHRDVKPGNILVDRVGEAHLADFGIARLADTTGLTATGLTLGTPAYLAPEQIDGGEIGPSADVYALGLVLIECLTGRRAFEGTPSEITAARLHRDPQVSAEFDDGWRAILGSMTARVPAERLTASEAAARLANRALEEGIAMTRAIVMPAISEGSEPFNAVTDGDTRRLAPTSTAIDTTRLVREPTAALEMRKRPSGRRTALFAGLVLVTRQVDYLKN